MYSQVEQLCVDGDFDKIHDGLIFLVSMNLITEDTLSAIFTNVVDQGKTAELTGLMELSDWIQHIWISYIKYSKLPKHIVKSLSSVDLPHISSNYISYVGSAEAKDSNNLLDTKEFNSLVSHLLQYYPQLSSLTSQLVDISAKLKNITAYNKDAIVQLLYEVSRGLDFSNSLSSVIRQKIKSQLNKLRLQLETTSQVKKEDDFTIFLREEGIADTVAYLVSRLGISLEDSKSRNSNNQ